MDSCRTSSRPILLVISILAFLIFVSPTMGQGFFGAGQLWTPTLTGFLDRGAVRGGSGWPILRAPNFYVGWVDSYKGAVFGYDAVGAGIVDPVGPFALLGSTVNYPIRGVWLGLWETIHLNENLIFVLGGSWLAPSKGRAADVYGFLLNGQVLQTPRSWSTSVEWWIGDAAIGYRFPGVLVGVFGYRHDSFMTNFNDTESIPPALAFASNQSDMTVSVCAPYLGAISEYSSSGNTLKAGLFGFPAFYAGLLEHKFSLTGPGESRRFESSGHFRSGYFLEAFVDYDRTVGPMDFGLFAKYTVLHGKGEANLKGIFSGAVAGRESQPFSFNFDRQVWILGGRFSLSFGMPI